MTFGSREKHTLEFAWGQWLGTVTVRVDGETVYRGRPIAMDELSELRNPYLNIYRSYISMTTSNRRIRSWELDVGTSEAHRIRIDKESPKLLAGMRPSWFRVYVDDQLIEERRGF